MQLKKLLTVALLLASHSIGWSQSKSPNFIIILADDLGYGDLGSFGHPTIRTPNLDKLAIEGTRFTQFYVAANVCSPSRAGLLTGRLPVRNGMYGKNVVFRTNSANGLPLDEVTIAEALKTKGYHTGIIGKWHLGHLPQYIPTKQGFDYWFGTPYSNDMGKVFTTDTTREDIKRLTASLKNPPLPLFKNDQVIEEEPDQTQLTKRYTTEAVNFIKENKDKPFFLYYPSNFPHTPLYASNDFKGKSKRGLYGDVVEELDWSVGKIISTLKELKLDKNTFVIFLSDNGPWLIQKDHGGSAGLLFEGKGSTYEGGMRVPAIAWWPGKVKANSISTELATSLDLFPTILQWAGAQAPTDRPYDGVNISGLLTGESKNVRNIVYYYESNNLYAIRKGSWKAHFTTHPSYSPVAPEKHETPLLYNLDNDPSEKYDVSKLHPDILEDLKKEYEKQIATVIPAPPLFDAVVGK